MYRRVHFDIAGFCNGRCSWCPTGRKTSPKGGLLPYEDFRRVIAHLLENSVIEDDAAIYLYNWGEPLLHPELREIISFLEETRLRYAISTNASKPVLFREPRALRQLEYVAFSVPGFSQSSYDRIHGLDFDRVKSNIAAIMENWWRCGFSGKADILYHVYQFNLSELQPASEFASAHGIGFVPYLAYLNSYEMFRSYLLSEMPYDEVKRASRELFLFYVDERRKAAPEDYRCPQFDILTLDEDCNVVTCCALEKGASNYAIGSLFDLSYDEIRRLKEEQPVCTECAELGLNYLFHNLFLVAPPWPDLREP